MVAVLAGVGWLGAAVAVLVAWFAFADAARWRRVAGERATCWSIVAKRNTHLEAQLRALTDERRPEPSGARRSRLGVAAGSHLPSCGTAFRGCAPDCEFERLGAMPEATGSGGAASRARGADRTPPVFSVLGPEPDTIRPFCDRCASRAMDMGGHWKYHNRWSDLSAGYQAKACDHCGMLTNGRLEALRVNA